MSVRACVFPWHWLQVTHEGEVLPCSHGAAPVGDLRQHSILEIWNGSLLQEVRAAILEDRVHPVCQSADCPFQRPQAAFPTRQAPLEVTEEFAQAFDEEWYLATYENVRIAVGNGVFTSGLEHYVRHGRTDGNQYRLTNRPRSDVPNAVLALVEYTRGATIVRNTPVDLVITTTTLCNLRCVMCPHGMGLVPSGQHFPVELLERTREIWRGVGRMIVSGLGEPTRAAAFWRLIAPDGVSPCTFMRVNSNGHFLNAETIERLLDSMLTEISFSIDAASELTYRKIRNGDLPRVQAGIAALVAARSRRPGAKLKIFINMTLMAENLPEAADFVDVAHALGVDGVIFTQLFAFGDRPEWRVSRHEWTFVYSEQMPSKMPDEVRVRLGEIQERSRCTGVPALFLDNVAAYLP